MGEPHRPALAALAAEAGVCAFAIGLAARHYMDRTERDRIETEKALINFAAAGRKEQAKSIISAISYEGFPDYGMCGATRCIAPDRLTPSEAPGSAATARDKLRTWA